MTIRKVDAYGASLGANTFTGAQVAPSLALGGASLGSNALAVTGSMALGAGAITYSGSMTGNMSIAMSGLGLNWAAARTISMSSLGNIGFAATDTGTVTNDTAFSRISAGIIGVGTGAAGNIAGGLQAATLALGGANIASTFSFAATGNFQIGVGGGSLFFTNASRIDDNNGSGLFRMFNAGATSGIGLGVTTNGVLAVRTSNNGADGAITASTGAFSGAVSLGNTVNSVSPTAPNRTVTMVIGGTTYYLAAKTTND